MLLFVPPKELDPFRRVSPGSKCASCGNRGGKLEYSRISVHVKATPGESGKPMVRWTCNTCNFACYEDLISYHKYPAA